jgi:capsular polysaccharide biosynthesis protein
MQIQLKVRPAKFGVYTRDYCNYYHGTFDYIFGLNHYMKSKGVSLDSIIMLVIPQNEFLTKLIKCIWPDIKISFNIVKETNIVTCRGRNPAVIEWDEIDTQFAQELYSKVPIQLQNEEPQILLLKRESPKRLIYNIDELFTIMKREYPNVILDTLEGKTLEEQMKLFRSASIVIGQHGAALTNIIYSNRTSHVIELDKNNGRRHFENVCKYLGMKYNKYVFCQTETVTLRQKSKAEKATLDVKDFMIFFDSVLKQSNPLFRKISKKLKKSISENDHEKIHFF